MPKTIIETCALIANFTEAKSKSRPFKTWKKYIIDITFGVDIFQSYEMQMMNVEQRGDYDDHEGKDIMNLLAIEAVDRLIDYVVVNETFHIKGIVNGNSKRRSVLSKHKGFKIQLNKIESDTSEFYQNAVLVECSTYYATWHWTVGSDV